MNILSIHAAINPAAFGDAPKKPADARANGVPNSTAQSGPTSGSAPPTAQTPAEERTLNEAAAPQRPHVVINGENIGIQFETDDVSGTTIIRLVDLESGEVVRQIPPEEILNYLRRLESMMGKIFSRAL